MVSTVSDMHKWMQFIASGKVLRDSAQEHYWVKGVLAGGSDRGFLFVYSQGFDSGFFLSSNAHIEDGDLPGQISGVAPVPRTLSVLSEERVVP